jgi:hypothetical protein
MSSGPVLGHAVVSIAIRTASHRTSTQGVRRGLDRLGGRVRAIVVGALGGPEVLQVLQVREVDRPSADPGETLIQVDRAGVNFSDIGRRRNGWNNPTQPLPVIPGFEVVGRRVSDGARVMPASLTLPVPEGARRTGTRPLQSPGWCPRLSSPAPTWPVLRPDRERRPLGRPTGGGGQGIGRQQRDPRARRRA